MIGVGAIANSFLGAVFLALLMITVHTFVPCLHDKKALLSGVWFLALAQSRTQQMVRQEISDDIA